MSNGGRICRLVTAAIGSLLLASGPLKATESGVAPQTLPAAAQSFPSSAAPSTAARQEIEKALRAVGVDGASADELWRLGYLYHANGYEAEAASIYEWLLANEVEQEDAARLHYLLADLARERGDLRTAAQRLRDSVAAHSAYPLSHAILGDALFKSGDLEGAERSFQAAIDLDRDASAAWLGLARVRAQQGREAEAIELLEALLRSDAESYNAQALLAQMLARRGEAKQAAALRQGMTRSSSAPVFDLWMQPVLDAVYDPQRLDFLFLDYFMVGEHDAALPYLKRMEQVDPDNPRSFQYRGLWEMESGRWERAESAFRRGIELGGDPATLYPQLMRSLSARELWGPAESAAREGLEACPSCFQIWQALSRLLFERERFDEAADALESGVAANPYDIESHLLLARAALWTAAPERAEASFAMILQLAPADPAILSRAALIRMESKQFQQALPLLERVYELSPEFNDTANVLADAYARLGEAARARGEAEAALARFEQALALQPARLDALAPKAQLLIELGRLDAAETAMSALIDRLGPNPALLMAQGDVLFRNGKATLARNRWQEALRLLGKGEGNAKLERQLQMRLR